MMPPTQAHKKAQTSLSAGLVGVDHFLGCGLGAIMRLRSVNELGYKREKSSSSLLLDKGNPLQERSVNEFSLKGEVFSKPQLVKQ